ncbi:BMP family ABC transporter substrate-binding protein [Prosthecomicrobium pneumaticum]|uniref:Simple sugar transport system substrate-binding protein n=1 Tax=Prosthecomicrobium pneumaticum TaxID=81895 RepID=A0A7W9L2F6_9HYPH|nr:BMP family ABC transporter substrate-binding protein [Prosthecomicrobium pneumaticum]MBB5753515.1 simple sugar transport system substrate-binding protein [Prosthecomicrobium pneumaticum]
MSAFTLSRRSLLKSAAIGALGATSGISLIRPARAESLTIGIVYVGPRDDFGWNQAHAVAAAALKQVPDVTVVEEENVPETAACAQSMESMISLDGAKLIFATSFGYYSPFVVDLAKKYPEVQFRHAAPLWKEGDPVNAGSYFGQLDQAHYIDGIAAGLSTKSNKIGFVAAKPIGTVLLNINSFTLGVKKVNPAATVQVIFTGEWSMPVREAEAANALVDAGCDVLTCHVDGPKVVIETAEGRGVKSCGHNASQAPLAPKGFITGAEYKWETIYKDYAAKLAKGEALPNFIGGGFDKDFVQNTPYGAGATPEAIAAADAARAEVKAGKPIFVGPIKKQDGSVLLGEGQSFVNSSAELNATDYLIEGVIGSIT